MSKSKVALQLFIGAGFLFLISIFFDLEILELIAKPIIIPSISMFYLFEARRNYSLVFLTSLLFFFVGDMLYMLNVEELFFLGLLVF